MRRFTVLTTILALLWSTAVLEAGPTRAAQDGHRRPGSGRAAPVPRLAARSRSSTAAGSNEAASPSKR